MAEPQLVDYIKKAREAGQADEQSKKLLSQNGWTEAEIKDAFAALEQPKIQPQQAQPQPQQQPQVQQQQKPQPQAQPVTITQAQPQYKPQTQSPELAMQSNMPKTKKSHLVLKLLVVLIILVVIGGVGYFAFGQYVRLPMNLPWSFGNISGPNPESIISKAFNNLSAAKTENFNSELSLTGKDIKMSTGGGAFNLNAKIDGGVDSAKNLADVKATITGNATDDALNKYNLSATGEVKMVKKDFYFQLSDVNLGGAEGFLTMLGMPDISQLKGQWIKFQTDGSTQPAQASQNTKTALDKIVKILVDQKTYDISQLPDNNGTQGKEYHYYVSLNQQKIIGVSSDLFNVVKDYYPSLTLADFQKDINDAFGKIGKIGADVFIGKTDNFFHKVEFTSNIDISKFVNQATGTIQINYTLNQASMSQPVKVAAPANFKNFQDIFAPLLKKTKLQADMTQINFVAQSVFSTKQSYSSLCINGLLSGYLKMGLLGLSNDIVAQGAKTPVCLSAVKNYCVSTQLADGSYSCVGKSGSLGTTKCVSASTVCK